MALLLFPKQMCFITLFILTLTYNFIACVRDKNNNDYVQFIDSDFSSFPKCCPLKTSLVVTDEGTNCTSSEILWKSFEISATNIATTEASFSDNCENIECVDYLKNDTEWHLVRMFNCYTKTIYKQYYDFPKCCPHDHAYDPQNYNCVQQNHTVYAFNESLQVINVSLSHCPPINYAVVDFHDEFQVNKDKSVSLASGRSLQHGRYCIDSNVNNGRDIIRGCVEYEEACEKLQKRCLKKCCPDGKMYQFVKRKNICVPSYEASFNLSNNSRFNKEGLNIDYGIIFGGAGKKYLAGNNHDYYVDSKGVFHIYENNWIEMSPKAAYYCVENYDGKLTTFLFTINNTSTEFAKIRFYIHGVILGLSCFFLAITILCYLFLPEMQNVHSKSIMMLCIFLFFACLTLSTAMLNGTEMARIFCISIGFSIVFEFLGVFAWMNVICFDMWMAFGSMRVVNLKNKREDLKKFLFYNLYAWGIPIVICGFAVIVYITKWLPEAFTPHIGKNQCYFEKVNVNYYDQLIYFIIPESIMIAINIIFFLKTAIYCYKVKNEIQKMRGAVGDEKEAKQRKFQDDKEKLIMLVKLFLVMGIPWTFEALTSIFTLKHTSRMASVIETIFDSFNAAQGIIIFCIFILKKKVWISIKTRLGIQPLRRVSEFSTGLFRLSHRLYDLMIAKHRVVIITGKR